MKLNFSNTPIGRLRMAGITEGISFLLLLFIAMPLKYLANLPEAVRYIGWAHGLLFILFLLAVANVKFTLRWSARKVVIAFLASLIPFGTLLLDREWRKEEKLILSPVRK